MENLMILPSYIYSIRGALKSALYWTLRDLQESMNRSPEDYTAPGDDGPSIDVRLCIDSGRRGDGPSWIIRTGPPDYDPYHSEVCSSASVGPDTDLEDLLEDLIRDALDQCHERGN